MPETIAVCRQLQSIHQKLTQALAHPPYTAGYVQQLIYLAIDLLEDMPDVEPLPAGAAAKARQGLQTAQVLADRYDEMNVHFTPLYEMADVLQPALEALTRFLLSCELIQERLHS